MSNTCGSFTYNKSSSSSSSSTDPMAKLLTRLRSRTRISLVIFGAVMIHLTIGTYHTFGCFPFAMIIGGFLARRFGPRIAAGIGCYTMCASVFLSGWAIQHSYYAFLLTYGLMFGLGQGIAYVVAVSCVINWAPKMVGLGSGIVAAGFGISSSIFAPIQTRIINPHNVAPTSDGYFNDPELLSRVPGIFTTLSIVFFIMQCIGLIFICDPPTEFARRFLVHDCTSLIDMAWLSKRRSHWLASNGPPLLSSGWAQAKLGLTRVEQFGRYQYSKLSADDSDEQKNMAPDKLTTFGETFIDDDFFLAMAFSLGSIANAIARVGWGLLTDRTSFQTSLCMATSLATVLLLTMPLTALAGRYVYLLWTLSGIVLAIGSEYFLHSIGYNWAFILTACFPFIAFLLTSAIRITPQGHLIVSK
uniref:Uncharacterized protein n=1 Tax=Meloidogyne javanica TaxID=6303 RepID=A0A915MUP7_MELJA